MANPADNVRLILACVKDGRLTADGARRWARRARDGESIQILGAMAPMPSREVLGPKALSRLTNELAGVLGGAGAATGTDDAEYDALFSGDPGEAREQAARAAAREAAQLSDEENYRRLFPDTGE